MGLRTRLFGKRIELANLLKLVRAMGEDPLELGLVKGLPHGAGGFTKGGYGKCRLVPVDGGIDIELYAFRERQWRDSPKNGSPWYDGKIRNSTDIIPLTGRISYEQIERED